MKHSMHELPSLLLFFWFGLFTPLPLFFVDFVNIFIPSRTKHSVSCAIQAAKQTKTTRQESKNKNKTFFSAFPPHLCLFLVFVVFFPGHINSIPPIHAHSDMQQENKKSRIRIRIKTKTKTSTQSDLVVRSIFRRIHMYVQI